MNLAVACGVAVGTAVLTGALLVGDSMRGSLRHLTLDRLGRIEEVLVADRFFRQAGRRTGLAARVLPLRRGGRAGHPLASQPGKRRSAIARPGEPGQPHRLRRAVLGAWLAAACRGHAGLPPAGTGRNRAQPAAGRATRRARRRRRGGPFAQARHYPRRKHPGAKTPDDPRPTAHPSRASSRRKGWGLSRCGPTSSSPAMPTFRWRPCKGDSGSPVESMPCWWPATASTGFPRRKTTSRCNGCCGRRWPISACRLRGPPAATSTSLPIA